MSKRTRWINGFVLPTLLGLSSLSALSGISSASTVSSVTCSSAGAPFAETTSSCNALGTSGYARAGASSTITLPATASEAAVINASINASALQASFHSFGATATATSSADIGIIFNTEGPVRNGLLELNFDQLNWTNPVNGSLSQSLAIAGYSAALTGADLVSVWIPIQLGTQFGFEYKQSVMAISGALTGQSVAAISSQISLLAFESDGITAVQLFDPPGPLSPALFTPEPASLGLMLAGAGLGVAFLLKKRGRS